jgi:peptidoglycan/LPS O-acetylase OafA/YrhL
MTKQRAQLLRKLGVLLIVSGAALAFVGSLWNFTDGVLSNPFWTLFVILAGTSLAGLRTESEREEEMNDKRARYARIVQRFGVERVRFALKAAVVAILALSPVALIAFLFENMPFFWLSLVLIACLVSLVVVTDNPDDSIQNKNSNQSR